MTPEQIKQKAREFGVLIIDKKVAQENIEYFLQANGDDMSPHHLAEELIELLTEKSLEK